VRDLARHFFQRFRAEKNPGVKGFSAAAFEALEAHTWPGNVRELINRVRRAMIMAQGRLIVPSDLGLEAPSEANGANALEDARQRAERLAIAATLQRSGRNVASSARQLGISRMTLYRLMVKHGIHISQ